MCVVQRVVKDVPAAHGDESGFGVDKVFVIACRVEDFDLPFLFPVFILIFRCDSAITSLHLLRLNLHPTKQKTLSGSIISNTGFKRFRHKPTKHRSRLVFDCKESRAAMSRAKIQCVQRDSVLFERVEESPRYGFALEGREMKSELCKRE